MAAFIAVLTIALAPGLSSAMSAKSKAYIQSIKDFDLNSRFIYSEVTETINRLGEISKEDDEAKKEVSEAIRCLCYYYLPHEHILQLTDILKECASAEPAKRYIARVIDGMIGKNWLKGYSNKQLLKVTETLIECASDESAKAYVVTSIGRMAHNGLLEKYSHEKLLELADISIECANVQTDQLYMAQAAYSINRMAKKDLFNSCSREKLLKLTDILIKFLGSGSRFIIDPSISCICSMIEKDLLNQYSSEERSKLTSALLSAANNNSFCRENAEKTIGKLAEKDLLNSYFHE